MRIAPSLALLGLCILLLPACTGTVATAPSKDRVTTACAALFGQSSNRTYETYFASKVTTPNERNKEVATNAAQAFLRRHGQSITVRGYIDRTESREVGWKRAREIAVILAAAGVPESEIYIGNVGSGPTPVLDNDEDQRSLSRKVGITPSLNYGGKSENECINEIRLQCFRSVDADQQHDCDNGLYLLAPNAGPTVFRY